MGSTIKRCLGKLACAAAIIGVAAVPAQAARYTGTFDPAFGGNFTGLGWEGTVVFDVPDDCLALGSASFSNLQCQSTNLLEAEVRLYDHPAKSQAPDVLDLFGSFSIYDIDVTGGTVVGIFAGMSGNPGDWIAPDGTLNAPVVSWYADYLYGLSLFGDVAGLRANSPTVLFDGNKFVDELPGQCPWDGDYAICKSASEPTITFTLLVPEPGSLMLVAAALAAAGGAGRLRRRR